MINLINISILQDKELMMTIVKTVLIWRQLSNINLKINNNYLEVSKTY